MNWRYIPDRSHQPGLPETSNLSPPAATRTATYTSACSRQPCRISKKPSSPTGTKRHRSGRSTPPASSDTCPSSSSSALPIPSSARLWQFSASSESDGPSESETEEEDIDGVSNDELLGGGQAGSQKYNLAADHEYLPFRSEIVQKFYHKFRAWMPSARYAVPPGYRKPQRKRARVGQRPQSIYFEEQDSSDPQLIVVSRIDGYFRLACPFHRHDPIRYTNCIKAHDLQSIEAVVAHLQQSHRLPAYCPICRRVFGHARARDEHVRERTCEFRREITIDGITERQMSRLVKRDDRYVREDIRWRRIFERVLPDCGMRYSPYLSEGLGHEVSLLRDYWARHGRSYLSEFFRSRDLVGESGAEEGALAALGNLILSDLIEKVLDRPAACKTSNVE